MELNPNHQVTKAIHDQWHKICAILMMKYGAPHEVITIEDISKLPADSAVAIQERQDGIHLSLVDMKTATKLAKEEGGLPV